MTASSDPKVTIEAASQPGSAAPRIGARIANARNATGVATRYSMRRDHEYSVHATAATTPTPRAIKLPAGTSNQRRTNTGAEPVSASAATDHSSTRATIAGRCPGALNHSDMPVPSIGIAVPGGSNCLPLRGVGCSRRGQWGPTSRLGATQATPRDRSPGRHSPPSPPRRELVLLHRSRSGRTQRGWAVTRSREIPDRLPRAATT